MEIVDIEKLMQDKYNECVEWLNGQDEAKARFERACLEYESAKKALDEYSDNEYVTKLIAYKDYLATKLGIVDDGDKEAQEEQPIDELGATDSAVEIDTTPLA